tara:strand:+ start:6520 stop:7038 length:519 start_codon:yes stop_codon:yes gene_type:complete
MSWKRGDTIKDGKGNPLAKSNVYYLFHEKDKVYGGSFDGQNFPVLPNMKMEKSDDSLDAIHWWKVDLNWGRDKLYNEMHPEEEPEPEEMSFRINFDGDIGLGINHFEDDSECFPCTLELIQAAMWVASVIMDDLNYKYMMCGSNVHRCPALVSIMSEEQYVKKSNVPREVAK